MCVVDDVSYGVGGVGEFIDIGGDIFGDVVGFIVGLFYDQILNMVVCL